MQTYEDRWDRITIFSQKMLVLHFIYYKDVEHVCITPININAEGDIAWKIESEEGAIVARDYATLQTYLNVLRALIQLPPLTIEDLAWLGE